MSAFAWEKDEVKFSFVGQKNRRWTRGPGDQGDKREETTERERREEAGKTHNSARRFCRRIAGRQLIFPAAVDEAIIHTPLWPLSFFFRLCGVFVKARCKRRPGLECGRMQGMITRCGAEKLFQGSCIGSKWRRRCRSDASLRG